MFFSPLRYLGGKGKLKGHSLDKLVEKVMELIREVYL